MPDGTMTHMKMLVLTPLRDELEAFRAEWCRQGLAIRQLPEVGRLPIFSVADLDIYLAWGGHGKTQFAVHTQHLLEVLCKDDQTPGLVVCAGAAGALAERLRVGDVVAAVETVEHDYNLKFCTRPSPRFPGDPGALERLRASNRDRTFDLHFGILASGDEDVIDIARGRQLRETTGAVAVAWEGAGGARASAFCGVPFLELRGITDTADHFAAADFEVNLPLAKANVATVIVDLAR
jgi:adenosylhomocysteine nucleosidase